MDRQTGFTTKQMLSAPLNAVFIWCNSRLDYPKRLANTIGRSDLTIVGPHWINSQLWRGQILSGIVVDHAAELTKEQQENLFYIICCVK